MLREFNISSELWREYDLPGREKPYRIDNPSKLFLRTGGTTHRVVDGDNIVHCIPAPGVMGCVLRWMSRYPEKPVDF